MLKHDIDNPDLPLAQLFQRWPDSAQIFFRRKMGCFGCLIAPFHGVTDACREYELDEDEFRAALRAAAEQSD
jgi:hybrid cluster-associated redox disulfide protein